MAQKMTATLVNDPELFDDLPTEIRFVEKALSIKGGTALRQYAIEEFCPAEGITFTALREGMRRLSAQMECMQLDPYGDITNTLLRLSDALAVGSEDERDAFVDYVANTSKNSPGWFQTYTFDHEVNSLVRFLDNTKKIEDGTAGPIEDVSRQLGNIIYGQMYMVEVGGWKINEVEKTSPCHLRKQNAKKNWTDNRNENAAL
eukprot:1988426-Ditylum_brightwellii.AAC.1